MVRIYNGGVGGSGGFGSDGGQQREIMSYS